MLYPALQSKSAQKWTTEQFLGLDRRPRTNDGAFCDMQNMSGDPWPLLCTRKRRGLVGTLTDPQGLMSNNGLLWIDGSTLYHNGEPTGINTISTEESMRPKRMVAMGAYVLIFPDGLYYNTVKPEDSGSINRLWENENAADFEICAMDGTVYPQERITTSDEEPADPENGDYWLDTSDDTHVLRQWRQDIQEWQSIATVYVRISCPGIGEGIAVQDAVRISGIHYTGENEALKKQLEMLNNTHVVQAAGVDFLVVIGLLDATYTQEAGLHADRKMPLMEHVIECNNRIWGCHWGRTEDGQTVNEIYASAMGDFKNFYKFMGTSQDSYTVAVGTEGPFTGAVNHRGQPYFFKSGAVHKIYGEKPSNYQMQTNVCDGVREGCAGTLLPINGMLYYVSDTGVKSYESMPMDVGGALGDERQDAGCAGEIGGRYYLSVKNDAEKWNLYVMDTNRGIWHREDASQAVAFAKKEKELYMLCADGKLWAVNGTEGTKEEQITWLAESAAMGYELAGHKYLSRFAIRVKLGEGAKCRLFIQYDGAGPWENKGSLQWQGKVRSYVLPVIPRRCDSMKLLLDGEGDAQIYTITRTLEAGADGQSKGKILD